MSEDGQVLGWKLEPVERQALLARFEPSYAPVCDHVTLDAHAARDAPPPSETDGEIVGGIDDGAGVQAMVVRIGGATDRPDGGTYHITWSLGPGRRAIESNDVIARIGWVPLDDPVPVTLIPARWPHSGR